MRERHRDSFEHHYARTYLDVRSFVLSLCGNVSDAEDIVQEALIKAYQAYDRFDGRASFESWVKKIAKNSYFDALRKERRRIPLQATGDDSEAILKVPDVCVREEDFLPLEVDEVLQASIRTWSPLRGDS